MKNQASLRMILEATAGLLLLCLRARRWAPTRPLCIRAWSIGQSMSIVLRLTLTCTSERS
jgi:hypothetical protein